MTEHTPTPSESEREALAEILLDENLMMKGYEEPILDTDLAVAAILADGFRRHPTPAPVVVRTVEDVRNLPEPARLVDRNGNLCAVVATGYYVAGFPGIRPFTVLPLPATVLTPATSATVSMERFRAAVEAERETYEAHRPHSERVRAVLRAAGLTVEDTP